MNKFTKTILTHEVGKWTVYAVGDNNAETFVSAYLEGQGKGLGDLFWVTDFQSRIDDVDEAIMEGIAHDYDESIDHKVKAVSLVCEIEGDVAFRMIDVLGKKGE